MNAMPHNSFPLFGEYYQGYRRGNLHANDEDDYLPDPRSAVRAWGLAALAVGILYALLVASVPRTTQEPSGLANLLPAGYQTPVAALVRAAGGDCGQLCSVALDPTKTGSLIARCARPESGTSCSDTTSYEIRVSALHGS
jgi:hypothetical protein